MLWKIKKVCEGEGPVGVTVAFGSGGSFSNLSTVRLLVTCSQLDLDVFALLSFYGLNNYWPDGASLIHVKDWNQSNKVQRRNTLSCQWIQLYGFAIKHAALHRFSKRHKTISEYLLSLHIQFEIFHLSPKAFMKALIGLCSCTVNVV